MSNPRLKGRPEGSNWGDFGVDDQLGRLNLLTQERVKQGMPIPKEGSRPSHQNRWADVWNHGLRGKLEPGDRRTHAKRSSCEKRHYGGWTFSISRCFMVAQGAAKQRKLTHTSEIYPAPTVSCEWSQVPSQRSPA